MKKVSKKVITTKYLCCILLLAVSLYICSCSSSASISIDFHTSKTTNTTNDETSKEDNENVNVQNTVSNIIASDSVSNNESNKEEKQVEEKLTLSLCGDNITHAAVIISGAKAYAGDKPVVPLIDKNGKKYLPSGTKFDYSNTYKRLIPYLEQCDINMINIESIAAGDEYNYTTFPAFNAPTEMMDELSRDGYNVFLHANNHCLDNGVKGLMNALTYEKENLQNVKRVGAFLDKDEFNNTCIIEKNGIKVAIINYTYSLNGKKLKKDQRYLCCVWDEKDKDDEIAIQNRVKAAKELADFVIVCPHWGVEYKHPPTSLQKKQAKMLSTWGADLIIGSHPHVIQTDEWIDNTYCIYSVGNIMWTSVSTLEDNRNLAIGLMPIIDISKKENGKVTIDKIQVNPTIVHEGHGADVYVSLLKDYDKEEAKNNMFMMAYKTYSIDDMWEVFHRCYDSVDRQVKPQ